MSENGMVSENIICLYSSLLDLSVEKRQAISKGDLSSLKTITQKECEIIQALTEAEGAFSGSGLSSDLGSGSDSGQVRKLVDLLARQKQYNQINLKMITYNLKYIYLTFQLLAEAGFKEAYNRDGKPGRQILQSVGLLDKKA